MVYTDPALKDLLVLLEIQKLDVGTGQGSSGNQDPLLAVQLHEQAGVAVAGLRQVSQRLPAAGLDVQELD